LALLELLNNNKLPLDALSSSLKSIQKYIGKDGLESSRNVLSTPDRNNPISIITAAATLHRNGELTEQIRLRLVSLAKGERWFSPYPILQADDSIEPNTPNPVRSRLERAIENGVSPVPLGQTPTSEEADAAFDILLETPLRKEEAVRNLIRI